MNIQHLDSASKLDALLALTAESEVVEFKELNLEEIERIRAQATLEDWSAAIVPDATRLSGSRVTTSRANSLIKRLTLTHGTMRPF